LTALAQDCCVSRWVAVALGDIDDIRAVAAAIAAAGRFRIIAILAYNDFFHSPCVSRQ
jgi:hypothetical protein